MAQKVLITGISGFAGSYLCEYLVAHRDYDISGVYLSDSRLSNLATVKDKISLHQGNLLEKESVYSLINTIKPDLVFHLAGLPAPTDSFKDPVRTFTNNVISQINIFEGLRLANCTQTRVLVVSSADVYGIVAKEDLPIDENTPFTPTNPYAVSKITQDYLGLQYFLSYKMPIIRVRPFNHMGPRQSADFVVAAFAKKIAEIEKGKQEPILYVGNLESKRDFTDVRDIVHGYTLILEKGKKGEAYNIGSGVSYSIQEILTKLLSFSTVEIKIKTDTQLLRPSDNPVLVCDNKKIESETGWKPEIALEQSLKETLDYWRNLV